MLRELVHLTAAHLAREPRFETKCLLADHLHDDAQAAAALYDRIAQLGQDPRGPGPELTALLDRVPRGRVRRAQAGAGRFRPGAAGADRPAAGGAQPAAPTRLVHRQERHPTELPATEPPRRRHQVALGDERPGRTVQPPPERPARDGFVEIAEHAEPPQDLQRYAHALLEARVEAAEGAGRALHESPRLDVTLARRAWDGARHAEALDHLMATELDCHWGDFPVSFGEQPADPPAGHRHRRWPACWPYISAESAA